MMKKVYWSSRDVPVIVIFLMQLELYQEI